MNSGYIESLELIKKQMAEISAPFKNMQESLKLTSNILEKSRVKFEPIVPKIANTILDFSTLIPKTIGISDIMKDYFDKVQQPLKAIQEVLASSGLHSKLNGSNVEMLNNFYWVVPFEYKYENLNVLLKYKDLKEYETYMLKYFNNNRIKRIFSKIRRQCDEKDKKEVFRQIERAFFNEDYAICITNLITLLDGLTLSLLTQDSVCQHLSYQAVDALLEYINECPIDEFGYELYLKVHILNNFYMILYENENFKNNKNKKLSRHLNSHGIKYLNTKVDALRLLNVICFCQEIIIETEMQEQFIRTKKDRRFKIKGSDEKLRK